ncbi:unnamed protein product [Chilo suppressalis]|uniref:Uncharacterized protein n=1 Tax=Chilo suppressalis TaxID=168631 RepID=A0ABN8AQ79_CHISP|nr:unnamed protein product [Chilo suppressalis]
MQEINISPLRKRNGKNNSILSPILRPPTASATTPKTKAIHQSTPITKLAQIKTTTIEERNATLTKTNNVMKCVSNDKLSNNLNVKPTEPHKVLIFGDDEAKGTCKLLQSLLGDHFKVLSLLKPGAKVEQILNSCLSLCDGLTRSDYVIIIGGSNDVNPMELQSYLYFYISKLNNTNVILSQIFKNERMNNQILCNLYRHLCNQFGWCTYVGYTFGRYYNNYSRVTDLCRNLLRTILNREYARKYSKYRESIKLNKILKDSKKIYVTKQTVGTQTSDDSFFLGDE